MVGRPLLEQVKKQKKRHVENAKYQAAVEEYQAEQEKPKDQRRGLRPIAAKHDVNFKTLSRLAQGGASMSAFNVSKRKLGPAEERVLVDFIKVSADRGFPLDHKSIEWHANVIIAKRGRNDEPVGVAWVGRFLNRHYDELQMHWASPLASERARALNPEAVTAWFDLVEELVAKKEIRPENIYAMDESGFTPAGSGVERVVGHRGAKIQHKVGSVNRENVTALVTICADGTTLHPSIIFKGKNFMKKWGEDNVANASICISENGWMDGELALLWMTKDFDPATREKAAGETRILFMDGHGLHYTADLLEYCKNNNIEILAYPPHCMHALQGLDVVCFARMKENWKEEVAEHENNTGRGVNKEDFCCVFGKAFLRTFTPAIVKSAFKKTGIHPFDRNVIKSNQMKPSKATSTHGSFPLMQSSPTHAVMAAFHDYSFTHKGLYPDSPVNVPKQSPGCFDHMPIACQMPMPSTPRSRRDPASDPSLPTPQKRMQLLGVGLASTSASFLVRSTAGTHQDFLNVIMSPVIECIPDDLQWSDLSTAGSRKSKVPCVSSVSLEKRVEVLENNLVLAKRRLDAQDLVIESQNAQLIVQNMVLDKMNQTLYAKETQEKKSERAVMFPKGHGRHLTSNEVITQKRALEEEKASKDEEKRNRRMLREKRRAVKEEIEAKWRSMLEAHEQAIADWKSECEMLKAAGKKQKDLPKRPKRPLKPKLKDTESDGDSDAEDSDGSD